jgi:hypothetical protein
MSQCPSSTAAQGAGEVSEFDISGLEAILAGTLCLMSAYSHCNCGNSTNQGLVGLKIVSNLTCLQYQNSLSPEFRRVLGKVCDSWRQHSLLAQTGEAAAQVDPNNEKARHWHAAPSTIQ